MAQPDTDFRGKVRAYDPDTSWDAAAAQTRTIEAQLKSEVLALLRDDGPMTDDELFDEREERRRQYIRDGNNPSDTGIYRLTSPQSVRSRRSTLTNAGRIRATGDKRPSNMGGPSNVWEYLE